MAKKKPKAKKKADDYPPIFEMVKARLRREGRYDEFMTKYQFHRDFGMKFSHAMWAACRDMGYKDASTERALYDEYHEHGAKSKQREEKRKILEAEQLETELRELSRDSEGKKFDAVAGIEWVASVFHLDHVTPAECPHIIAWNVLQTSKKYEVAFFKDFLMKALQKGITVESVEEYAEDETQLDDLRQAVKEAIGDDE